MVHPTFLKKLSLSGVIHIGEWLQFQEELGAEKLIVETSRQAT